MFKDSNRDLLENVLECTVYAMTHSGCFFVLQVLLNDALDVININFILVILLIMSLDIHILFPPHFSDKLHNCSALLQPACLINTL